MRKRGITILDPAGPPGVTLVKGEWPGIRGGRGRNAAAGPTGVPWVDSNGWQVRLARTRSPQAPVWVETEFPKEKRIFNTTSYLLALADAAMYGGRWIINLDPDLARGIQGGEAQALETWKSLMDAQRFYAAHEAWGKGEALGIVAILSTFAGENEFLGGELLNLTARLHQPYRILRIGQTQTLPAGLKSVIYADAQPPDAAWRKELLDFVKSGGLLITGGNWADAEGAPGDAHPRFAIRRLGKGRIACGDLSEPYQAANDAQILLSHRHDVVRFWNGGSLGSYLTKTPHGAVLQILNYTGRPGADPVSVRIAGPYRGARIQLLGEAAPKPLPALSQKEAIELHLPAIPVYAAIELT